MYPEVKAARQNMINNSLLLNSESVETQFMLCVFLFKPYRGSKNI